MLGKLSIAVAAILMMPTALSAQVGGAFIQGAVSQGLPTPAELSASSSAYYRSIQKHNGAPKKKLKRSDAQTRYMQSLDGRVTARPR
jgi:type IV secretory pathway TrbL component